jgi:benzoyl-CoA reductase/2-hydroxyglutaryl-CoA dehydratase subunit BcrC/BadD/HgdB
MSQSLESMQAVYRDRGAAARAWKARGGKVVGYVCDNVPAEMIAAAGFFPLRLSGDPDGGKEGLEKYVYPFPERRRFQKPGFAGAILNKVLTGGYDFVDYLVIPHNRKSIQVFYKDMVLAQRSFPELKLPELYYLDRAYTPFYQSSIFNRSALLDFAATLERWSGKPLAKAALSEAITEYNAGRRLIGELSSMRRSGAIPGSEALAAIGSSMVMEKHRHNELLRSYLDECGQRTAREGVRVFLGGSPQDHAELYELIEACGATIVAEDHCWGARAADYPVAETGDPLEALAERYHKKPACSIAFPLQETIEATLRKAKGGAAQAAIFSVMEFDIMQNWETPEELAALRAAGLPSLYLKRQAYRVKDPAALKAEVGEFLKAVH